MLRGSCLCGSVRFEITGVPDSMYYCHCGMCRKSTGSAFATNLLVRADDFVLVAGNDDLRHYESSPGEYRCFCGHCGSPVYCWARARSEWVSVRCGTLDDDPGISPSVHLFAASKAVWDVIHDQVPRVPGDVD